MRKIRFLFTCAILIFSAACHRQTANRVSNDPLKTGFLSPPDDARPGVYWYFMDGNLSRESMTKDLEAMKEAGIGNLVFLEVNVGVPRGQVDFLSEQWQHLFAHAVKEAERLGIEITLGVGPGWTGSGGPWVPAARSMQHLVASTVEVNGDVIRLPKPAPKPPYFGEGAFTPAVKKQWDDFYEDVAVLAFPTPVAGKKIADIDEKALYYRAPFSSVQGVKPYLPSLASYEALPANQVIATNQVIDLTGKLSPDGTLNWKAPAGKWTVMRFGVRNNGAVTRPAPLPGVGLEADKFDTVALNAHLSRYIGQLMEKTGKTNPLLPGGLKKIHMDSWEMGAQNWTTGFREAFIKRRGYDPLPYYPVYEGRIVGSVEISERFLWDLRLTAQEMVLEFHARHLKTYAHRHGFKLSIEPYDMNPTADLELGAVADIPMCEFWSKGMGFNSSFSCIEATSVAHVNGISLVPAEAFTADDREGWKQYPGSMKEQGDWAFAMGINRFVYHTFQNQTLPDHLKPGMTMGPYGVHWNRSQTWWPMAQGYHRYISRCQFMLQQGRAVADVLYLTPEGAPHVFRPPASALTGEEPLRDRRGYNFDGCSPGQLMTAGVQNKQIVFPGGATYRLLVLPDVRTMTPGLLEKIASLVAAGAVVVGPAPEKSPGLSGFPACDEQVRTLAQQVKLIWNNGIAGNMDGLYPAYDATAKLLKDMDVPEDFASTASLRYTHRVLGDRDIYFVSNKIGQSVDALCFFRTGKGAPELWDPLTGESRPLPEYTQQNGVVSVPLQFASYQSFFIVFKKDGGTPAGGHNFAPVKHSRVLSGAWTVAFDTVWGGPASVVFDTLADWTKRPEDGIRHYSGIATYKQTFDIADVKGRLYLDLGTVHDLASVTLNGKELGVLWTAPWRVDITSVAKRTGNQLEIKVANRWPNRLIGDERLPDDGIKNDQWPEWLVKGLPRTSGRFTFTTYRHYSKDDALLPSGLVGPVRVVGY